jgi:hypothetical protein
MAHIAGFKEVRRRDSNRKAYAEMAPVIVVDLFLRIKPPPGDEIILGDVRALVYQLAEHGYPIGYVSMDSHQSIDGIQQMNQRGLEAEVLSVDRKPDPYECLKVAIYEGRVIFYTYPVVLKELAHLEKNHITGKVDHPEGGTKDVADALAAVVFSLTERRPINAHPLGLLRSLSYTPTVQSRAEAVVQEAVRASGPPPGTSPVLWMLGGSGRSDDDPLGL